MIYQCRICGEYYEEKDGVMVLVCLATNLFVNSNVNVFVCKNCLNEEERAKYQKIKK